MSESPANLLSTSLSLGKRYPRLSMTALGAAAAFGYPPFGLWPISLIALAAMIAMLRQARSGRDAAIMGWLFGWAHLSIANNWIATAFTFQSEMPHFLGWFAVPLLCIYLALYPAFAAYLTHRFASKAGILGFGLMFAGSWIVTEWLRSWVFTGYPWPPIGLIALGDWDTPGLAFLLPWLGTYALSGLVMLIAVLLCWAVVKRSWLKGGTIAAAVILAMVLPSPAQEEGDLHYTLVQPLLWQSEIHDPSKYEEQFSRLAGLTVPTSLSRRLVLWPESAIPDYLRDGYPQRYYSRTTAAADPEFARTRLGNLIGEQSILLTGTTELEIDEVLGRRQATGAHNVVSAIDGQGNLRASYSKAHLVPYGEYLALRWLLEPLGASRLVAGSIDYIPGPGPRTLNLGEWGNAGIQICYEIIFSGQVVDQSNRPNYIFNPSNDGWFGAWGPPQHLGQARLRAIEEGLPVLRSTTTGISAIVDANGIVRQHIASGKADRLEGLIPPASSPTLFSRLGNALPLGWALALILASLVAMRRGKA
ncbi:MAG: apolipoprotein N-acyltransferase [Erythrobacter sp.]